MKDYLLEIIIAVFGLSLSILGTLIVIYFKDLKDKFDRVEIHTGDLASSVNDLNVKMERVITAQDFHKEEMQEVKKRLRNLEGS